MQEKKIKRALNRRRIDLISIKGKFNYVNLLSKTVNCQVYEGILNEVRYSSNSIGYVFNMVLETDNSGIAGLSVEYLAVTLRSIDTNLF